MREKTSMPCLQCGDPKTIRAHILPAAVGKDIIACGGSGKTLSLAAPNRIDNAIQSGLFDRNILCSVCDGTLNVFDKHAIELSRLLGTCVEFLTQDYFFIKHDEGLNHDHIALFAAAVVWRASVSNYSELQQFKLNTLEQERFRAMIFGEVSEIPKVAVLRLGSENPLSHEDVRLAMSYPNKLITDNGHQCAKFSMRGLLFLISIKQGPENWLQPYTVTTLGRAYGPAWLTGLKCSFDDLLKIDNVRNTKYVNSLLGPELNTRV